MQNYPTQFVKRDADERRDQIREWLQADSDQALLLRASTRNRQMPGQTATYDEQARITPRP